MLVGWICSTYYIAAFAKAEHFANEVSDVYV
jgi:hypothetical protein